METVGERLKQLRLGKGMTQAETAKAVTASTHGVIANWEANKTTPRPQFLQAYSDFFEVSEDWIINGNEDDAPTIRNKLKEMENAMDFILDYLTTLDRRQDLILQGINELKEMMKSAPTEKFKE